MHLENYSQLLGNKGTPRLAFGDRHAQTVSAWQDELRSAVRMALGLDRIAASYAEDTTFNAQKRSEVHEDDHIREEWVIQTEPNFQVPLFLLRPLNVSDSSALPLVITPHGHSTNGRYVYAGITQNDSERHSILEGERDIALQAVREGYISLAFEARAFGESRGPQAIADGSPNVCELWQKKAMLHGRTLIGERVWDVMRLIDWATSRSEIDASRIAITGNSGGGTISLFAAAMDQRIGVCVPGSYFCTFVDSIGSIYHCGCNYIPGILELAEMSDIAGLIAPRPFLAVHGETDPFFPIAATRSAFASLEPIYAACNAQDRCQLHVGDGGHRYYKAPVWSFMKKWL